MIMTMSIKMFNLSGKYIMDFNLFLVEVNIKIKFLWFYHIVISEKIGVKLLIKSQYNLHMDIWKVIESILILLNQGMISVNNIWLCNLYNYLLKYSKHNI